MNPVFRIALLGAESTGKTSLSLALAGALRAQGHAVAVVAEVLRGWCDEAGRTPRVDEQMAIARLQARRVDEAEQALRADSPTAVPAVLIADTTPLMIAVYSDLLFADLSLYDFALAHQKTYACTLVTGLDVPWVADGLQRDGPHVRAPVDALVRSALARGGVDYQVVYGSNAARLHNTLLALQASDRHNALPGLPLRAAMGDPAAAAWLCDKCSDPACEHRLFGRLLARGADSA